MNSTRKMEVSTKLSKEERTTLTALIHATDLYTTADLKPKGSILVGFAIGYFGYEAWDRQREKVEPGESDILLEQSMGRVREAVEIEKMADAKLWEAVEKCGDHDTELGRALRELTASEILPSHGPDG
ncbi:hypothetical protein LTR56_026407 [Elasticomyces elasticus]|nr:hypothetical protein LTR56_026407 [Elasticomyces elasticus]KAK3618069.1 hypothetical protein LTR22_026506 [Elasticomyces elasticus]KAK4902414.1 hypothetical protein LTR49_027061 [Elasticomyces elasticus]KAK5736761.1 hypothetical protein LTS12_026099 [Elasticomyces elasticus]